MTRFIVLNPVDMLKLQENQPIKMQIDSKSYTLITEAGLNKLMGVGQSGEKGEVRN